MKQIKRLFAVVLTLAMVLGMSVVSLAATAGNAGGDGIFGTSDDKGTLSIGGITMEDNLTVTAYPIIKAVYGGEGSGTFTGYDVVYKDVDPAISMVNGTEPTITEKHLTAIMGALKTDESYPMTLVDGTATADVPVGSYLVVIQGAETKVYSPIVASAYYVNKDGQNAVEGKEITDIAVSQNWVKVTDTPKVDKSILEKEETGEGEEKVTEINGNSVNIGDEIDYKIAVGPIPYYGGAHPLMNLVDTLDAGLDRVTALDEIAVGISSDDGKNITPLTYGTDYTIQEDATNARKMTINFVVSGYKEAHAEDPDVLNDYTLNAYAKNPQNKIIITYTAKLNDQAAINQTANANEVVLHYTPDSKIDGLDETDDDKVYTYTFDIDGGVEGSVTDRVINKRGEAADENEDKNGNKGLDGAEFSLFTDAECTKLYTNPKFSGTVTTANAGQMHMKGLEEGTYYLKETKAPEGYSLNTEVYKIVIAATYSKSTDKKEAGLLTGWTITINNVTIATEEGRVSEFTVDHGTIDGETIVIEGTDIQNTKLSSLPSTGGIGTTIFTIGGCLIMIIAAGLFFASRRKSAK